jgi:hypothetical protein
MNWIPLGISFKETKKRGILKAGVILDFGDEKLLVGHINEIGGQCDDCPIAAGRVVKAYAEAFDFQAAIK